MTLATARARHVGGEVVVDVADVSGDAARTEGDAAIFDEGTAEAGTHGDGQDDAVGLARTERGFAQTVGVHVVEDAHAQPGRCLKLSAEAGASPAGHGARRGDNVAGYGVDNAGAGDGDTAHGRVRGDQGRSKLADARCHVRSATHRIGGDRSALGDLVRVTSFDDAPPDLGATDVEGKERSHEDPYGQWVERIDEAGEGHARGRGMYGRGRPRPRRRIRRAGRPSAARTQRAPCCHPRWRRQGAASRAIRRRRAGTGRP